MNMLPAEARRFCAEFANCFKPNPNGEIDCGIAPPYLSIDSTREALLGQDQILLGAQNVHWEESGAHTGEISALMLKNSGVQFVIIGHSERRQFYGERDKDVAMRAATAVAQGLIAVLCLGESEEQYRAGETNEICRAQIRAGLEKLETAQNLVVAYEPVWAIGTGLAATPEHARGVHALLRTELVDKFGPEGEAVRILYGGSTKPGNVAELVAQDNVDGALVGGASLKAETFWQIIANGRQAQVDARLAQAEEQSGS